MTRSRPTASLSRCANARSGCPSLKSAEPAMICCAPAASTSCARSRVRMPPPTRHESAPAICRTIARLSPQSSAASRSMTCTFGKRSNRCTQRKTSSSLIASRSPCTSCTTAPPWRSMEGISMFSSYGVSRATVYHEGPKKSHERHENTKATKQNDLFRAFREFSCFSWCGSGSSWKPSQPHGYAPLLKVKLERPYARFRVMKDRRRERRVGAAGREDVDEVIEAAGAAGGDDRDRHGRRHGGRHRAVGAGLDGRGGVGFGADAASDRKRNEELASDARDCVRQRAPRFEGRRDIENHQLVDAFGVVSPRQLGRIAGRPQSFEVDALDDLAVPDVKAGDDAFREHRCRGAHGG